MHLHKLSIRKMVSLALLTAGLSACNNGDDGLLGGPTTPENTAPLALNVAVRGHITAPEATRSNVTTTLQLTGDYFDAESDVADTHEFRWKKNGALIDGANSSKLVLNSEAELLDAEFVGCVTPIAKTGVRRGLEVCAPASNDSSPAVPPGTPVPAAQPTITGDPKVGETIKSSYTYAPNGTVAGSAEGGSEFGWLIYRDPSLPSWSTCQAGAEVDCNYTVDAADKDKTIYSCVQPRNQLGVWGAVRCDSTNAYNNVAPELRNAVIWGVVQNSVTLTASAQYFDQDGDQADSDAIVKSIRWLRRGADGNETQVATGSATYQVTGAVEGAVFKACATPYSIVPSDKPYVVKSGIEVCTTTSVGNPDNPEQPPVVLPPNSPTPLATPTISGTPLQGRTIQASYSYDANVQQGQDGSQSSEDPAKSQFAWLVENASGLFELQQPVCTAGAGTPCDLTVTNAMVGKKLKACVLPANQLGAYGPIACTDVAGDTRGIGVTLSGELEYGKTLTAHVVGLDDGTYQYQWKMNLATYDGPLNDTLASRTEVVAADGGAGNSNTFTIGTLHISGADSNSDGVITDSEWVAKYPDSDWMKLQPTYTQSSSAGPKDANFFIGKDVTLCLTGTPYGDDVICVDASEQQSESEGIACSDSSRCVISGIRYGDSLTDRGVSPVSTLALTSGAIYNRQLSIYETKALAINYDSTFTANGIYFPSFFGSATDITNNRRYLACSSRGLGLPVHGFDLQNVDGVYGDNDNVSAENGIGADETESYVLRNSFNSVGNQVDERRESSLWALSKERFALDETYPVYYGSGGDNFAVELYIYLSSPTTGWLPRRIAASASLGVSDSDTPITYHSPSIYRGDPSSPYFGLIDMGAVYSSSLASVCINLN
ncbi:MAG: hypothetical protein ACRC1V_09615 [Plesiomonas sp.]